MQARLFHLHALSALHCGTGQSTGVVDLPIARARATRLPIAPASSLRGVLRHEVANRGASDESDVATLFGPRSISGDADAFAGALSIGDAYLLLLPVRCLAGIVSYVTSPFILRRYARDLTRAGVAPRQPLPAPDTETAKVTTKSVNLVHGRDGATVRARTPPKGAAPGESAEGTLVLEDLDLTASTDAALTVWAEHVARAVHPGDAESQCDLVSRVALLPDTVMSFLADTATETRARIAIDPETGTVSKGALWYEELLPAEAVLWGVYALSDSNRAGDPRSADALARALPGDGALMQIGGHAGVGSGLVRFLAGTGASEGGKA